VEITSLRKRKKIKRTKKTQTTGIEDPQVFLAEVT
jgi:hypothetical protein